MARFADLLGAPGTSLEADADIEAIYELCLEHGWSDGLPVIPPTAERVERMLAYCDRPWDEPIAAIPPRYGAATPLRLAANAVMAGCRPQYFPLVMLAIEAMAEEPFNLYGIPATTHPCAPLIIVNGPVAQELAINSGHSAFGAGWRSPPPNAWLSRRSCPRSCLVRVRPPLLNVPRKFTRLHCPEFGMDNRGSGDVEVTCFDWGYNTTLKRNDRVGADPIATRKRDAAAGWPAYKLISVPMPAALASS